MTWAVLATGPSLTQDQVNFVKGRCNVVAVSDSYRIAPWADALVSSDRAWWVVNGHALSFNGPKYGAMHEWHSVEGVERLAAPSGTNSGLLGLMLAVQSGAERVILLGCDLHTPGEHYFGRHPDDLKSTTAARMETFKQQFQRYKPQGVDIVNCSPGSALKCYRMGTLETELC